MYKQETNLYIPTVYFDMDGVLADFERAILEKGIPGHELKLLQGTYLELLPYKGGLEALEEISKMGFNTHIATKIPEDNDYAATEKLLWLKKYAPHMRRHTTITHNKGQLSGDTRDFIIDDRIHKANIINFKGTVLHFGPLGVYKDWESVLSFFDKIRVQ